MQRKDWSSFSELEKRVLVIIQWTRDRLPHPLWGLVAATLIPITGHSYLVLRSVGLLIVAIWLAVEFLAWWLPLNWKPQYRWIVGITVVNLMFVGMMWAMWWWLSSDLEDQRTDVSAALTADHHLVPGQEDIPTSTMFTVTNNSRFGISKKNRLLCYVNYAVGNTGSSLVQNMWEGQGTNPVNGQWQGMLSGAPSTKFFWESMVDGSPIESGGDATTDECLKVIGFRENTQCVDVNLVFLYTLEAQPDTRQEREFRYVGTTEGKTFFWRTQPVKSKTNYCKAYYKGPY